jgi:rod shape determining protein RodA
VVSIYVAVYDEETAGIFDFNRRSGMQILWITVACIVAIITMIVEGRFYFFFSQIIYILCILLMLVALFFGREINGSKSWIFLGPASIQPVEFMKVATALLLAKIMSVHGFKMQNFRDFLKAFIVIAIPVGLTILQHDTGSALVFASFIIVFYRAGLKPWIVATCVFLTFLFILSLLVEQEAVIIFLGLLCVAIFAFISKRYKQSLIAILIVAIITCIVHFGLQLLDMEYPLYESLLIAHGVLLFIVLFYSIRHKLQYLLLIMGFFVISTGTNFSVNYVFDNVLKEHQRRRINDLLGIESDLRGWGYSVHQSKVAIGSGGLTGKGFFEGTQTKFNFVPEQSTDFIFCTIGEEWGFLGATFVILLYLALLIRIINMAERQQRLFTKLYGYSVASVLLFHVIVNIGMTIGIMPVVGIPLPFISYGGSSLWAFTIMLFILLKLDVARYE